jgi:hypothetical protein
MDTRNRWHRAAAVTLALAGLLLLGAAAVVLKESLPDLQGAQGEMMAGEAGLYAMTVSGPFAVGGLLALLGAWLLWRGSPAGVAVALLWVAGAGLAGAIGVAADGNVLWAVRMIVLESADWSVSWPSLEIGTASGGSRICGLNNVTSWVPVVAAVGAVTVACFLLAGREPTQRRDRPARP